MATIHYITQIQIDFGALSLLKAECERVGISRPLIVTDAGVKAVGILDKAMAALPEGPLKTYATIEGGSPKITDRVAPLIAVPTTAGTGSEVARGAILIVDDGRKLGFHSWSIVPKTAICDPELTLGLPPVLTAATGMDAIAHCMETFMAAPFNPPADGIALDGLARGWAHIERVT